MNTSFFYYLYHPFTQSPGQEYEHIRPATNTQHKITYAAFCSFDLSSTIALSSFSKKTRQIVPAATILPVGLSYEVTETVPDYYIQISAEGNIGKITGKETAEAVFTNRAVPDLVGDLSVTKDMEGNDESNDIFEFTITLSDTTITGEYGDFVFEAGVGSGKCSAGETITAKGLPAGISFVIEEKEIEGYYLKNTENDEGTIPDGGTVSAKSVNGHVTEEEPPEVPKTGDESGLYTLLTIASAFCVAGITACRKKCV